MQQQPGSWRTLERVLFDAPGTSVRPPSLRGAQGRSAPWEPRAWTSSTSSGTRMIMAVPKPRKSPLSVSSMSAAAEGMPWLASRARDSDDLPGLPQASWPLSGQPTSRQRPFSLNGMAASCYREILSNHRIRLCAMSQHWISRCRTAVPARSRAVGESASGQRNHYTVAPSNRRVRKREASRTGVGAHAKARGITELSMMD